MRALPLLLCLAACTATAPRPAPEPARPHFDAHFTGATLRLDLHHSGTAGEERVGVDRWRVEGAWPGSRTQLLDDTDLGKYRFTVRDEASGVELFSRGYASIYGEWETTGEAKSGWRTFHESLRFPEPRARARVTLEKREATTWREVWRGEVDPASRFVDRSPLTPRGELVPLVVRGPASEQVDLLVVAEGYTDRERFERDARRLVGVLLDTEPYRSRREDFDVRLLYLPAAERGISNPRAGVWRDSPLGCSFNAFDVDRYVLTYANATLREVAAQAPYDALVLLLDEEKYGGGGIYGLWATVAASSDQAPYLFVHEFGHSFAGLADEYYSSQVAYEDFQPQGVEPWEPNATALLDPARLKWRDLVQADTPLPTPWEQEDYDRIDVAYQARRKELLDARAPESASAALMREVKDRTGPFLAAQRFAGRVGAFRGAMYEARRLYRPEVDCIMFTRNPGSFCRVCARAVERAIDGLAR